MPGPTQPDPGGTVGPVWPPISYWAKATVAVVAVLATAAAVFAVRDVLLLILVAFVFGIGLQRPTDWLERHGVRRGAALSLMVFAVLATVSLFLWLVIPSVTRSIQGLFDEGPDTIDKFRNQKWVASLDERFDVSTKLEEYAADLPSEVAGAGMSLLTLVAGGVTVLVLTLYFASALPQMVEGAAQLMRPHRRDQFDRSVREVIDRVGGYVVGNTIVSVIAGIVTFLGLLVIGVPFPAALAFWVAVTDFIPSVGALIGAVVVLAVSASGGPGMFLWTAAFVVVYQQLENYLIVPRVMRNTIDVSVGAVLMSILVGGALAGFPGVVLALPLMASCRAVMEELWLRDRRRTIRRESARERIERIRAIGRSRTQPLP